MKIVQRIVVFSSVAVAAAYFFYTLAFSTGWALGETLLGDFFALAQVANHEIYRWGLWLVVAAASCLLFNTHKNNRFYVTNFLSILVTSALMFKTAAVALAQIDIVAEAYQHINPIMLRFVVAMNNSTIGVKIFSIGETLVYGLFIEGGLLLALTTYKIVMQIVHAKPAKSRRPEAQHDNPQC